MEREHLGTVVIETHGCKLNLADSELLATEFSRLGYTVVETGQPADVYVLNSCTVTRTADRKARQALRAAHRRAPDALVVATGCYAQRAAQELREVPGVALVAGNSRKAELVREVLRLRGQTASPCTVGVEPPWPRLPRRTRAFVKIQEGCNQVCAYCIVPRVRGRERSIPSSEIVREVRQRVAEGYQEVVLTGTQLGSYGFDLPNATLPALLGEILQAVEVPRLRVSSLQPQEITRDLLRLWQDDRRLCPHFHMPLQSGNDRVLARMRRRYGAAEYLAAVERVRAALPHSAITADVIVGFPGETEEDFQETLALCRRVGFADLHVFPYSVRPGTSAAYFPDRVGSGVVGGRMRAMLGLAKELAAAHRQRCLGRLCSVLWEEEAADAEGPPRWSGLTETYLRVHTRSWPRLLGRPTQARVVAVNGDHVWVDVLDAATALGG